jgi:hypothetical protein
MGVTSQPHAHAALTLKKKIIRRRRKNTEMKEARILAPNMIHKTVA